MCNNIGTGLSSYHELSRLNMIIFMNHSILRINRAYGICMIKSYSVLMYPTQFFVSQFSAIGNSISNLSSSKMQIEKKQTGGSCGTAKIIFQILTKIGSFMLIYQQDFLRKLLTSRDPNRLQKRSNFHIEQKKI